MSKQTNYGGKQFVVDRVVELFGSSSSTTPVLSSIKTTLSQAVSRKNLDDIREEINKSTSDGIITSQEKTSLKREWASLLSGYNSVDSKFSSIEDLSSNSYYTSLKSTIADLSAIMDEVFADMDSDYTDESKISRITDMFVSSWDGITECEAYYEYYTAENGKLKLSIEGDSEIISDSVYTVTLYMLINGKYVVADIIDNWRDHIRWYKLSSPDETIATGRRCTITIDAVNGESPAQFAIAYSQKTTNADNEEITLSSTAFFNVSYGTLKQYSYSNAYTYEDLMKDKDLEWASSTGENTGAKLYLWRRETKDLNKDEAVRSYEYFRETGKEGDDGFSFTVQILSSNGSAFRFPNVSTVLSCVVFKNTDDITDRLEDSRFIWKRNTGDELEDERWNTSSKAIGHKSVSITSEDCSGRTVFDCEVDLEGIE